VTSEPESHAHLGCGRKARSDILAEHATIHGRLAERGHQDRLTSVRRNAISRGGQLRLSPFEWVLSWFILRWVVRVFQDDRKVFDAAGVGPRRRTDRPFRQWAGQIYQEARNGFDTRN
jgi:hypothetical protein